MFVARGNCQVLSPVRVLVEAMKPQNTMVRWHVVIGLVALLGDFIPRPAPFVVKIGVFVFYTANTEMHVDSRPFAS